MFGFLSVRMLCIANDADPTIAPAPKAGKPMDGARLAAPIAIPAEVNNERSSITRSEVSRRF